MSGNGYRKPFFIGITVILALVATIWGVTMNFQVKADTALQEQVSKQEDRVHSVENNLANINATLQRIDQRTLGLEDQLNKIYPYVKSIR